MWNDLLSRLRRYGGAQRSEGSGASVLPPQVADDAGSLISALEASGWNVSSARYDAHAFGNWYVDLERHGEELRLIKDRSQFTAEGPSFEERQAAHLGTAYNSFHEFQRAVLDWAQPRQ